MALKQHLLTQKLFAYNEMPPSTKDTKSLRRSSRGTFEGIREADPKAIWIMQGWLFVNEAYFGKKEQVEAYLSVVIIFFFIINIKIKINNYILFFSINKKLLI